MTMEEGTIGEEGTVPQPSRGAPVGHVLFYSSMVLSCRLSALGTVRTYMYMYATREAA